MQKSILYGMEITQIQSPIKPLFCENCLPRQRRKNMKRKILCLLLALILAVGALPVMGTPAQAAGNGVAQKISQLRSKFPHHAYWNHWIDNWNQSGDALMQRGDESYQDSVTQSQCANHNGVSIPGFDCNYFDGGIQCWGFAGKIFYDIFGVRKSQMARRTDLANISVGDYVRFGSDGNGHSAVVIGRNGDSLTLVEGNFNNRCMINWDRQINLWNGDPYVGKIAYFCHASNYDTVNGSSPAPTPSTLTLDPPTLIYADDTNAQVESYIRNGGNPVYCSQFGLKVWEKATGNLIVDHKEDISAGAQGKAFIQIWVNLTRELGITLKPGTEYEWQYSAITDGKTINSEKRTYKTTGPTPTPVPTPTPAKFEFKVDDVKYDDVTSTNAVVRIHYSIKNSDKINPALYKACGIVVYKLNADGTREKVGLAGHPYTPEDLKEGAHIISFDLNASGIQLEPGTNYRIDGTCDTISLVGFSRRDLTTPAESATPSPSPTPSDSPSPSPTPSASPRPGDDDEPSVQIMVIGDYNQSMEYEIGALPWKVTGMHIVVEKDGQVIYDQEYDTFFKYTFPGPGSYRVYGKATSLVDGTVVTSEVYTVTIPGSVDPGTPTPNPDPTSNPWGPTPEPDPTPVPDPSPVTFSDVSATAYYANAVSWAVNNGITSGIGNGKFGPDVSCTRGQMVVFLWKNQGQPEPQPAANPFVDVKESDYFYKAVLWAAQNNISAGTDETHFSPNLKCTRAQAVTFLWRVEGNPEAETRRSFSDVSPKSYYAKAVDWAVEYGVTSGIGNGKFGPNVTCSRGQIVTFLYAAR